MEDAEKGDVAATISHRGNESIADHVTLSILEDVYSLFTLTNDLLFLNKDISTIIVNSVDIRIQALSKVTQEVEEREFTFFIIRSDKCYNNGETCDEEARCVKVNATSDIHTCKCKEDFEGNGYSCEKINDCEEDKTNKCGIHGECVDDINSYKCHCLDDYSGPKCEIAPPEKDVCTENECKNKARCLPDESVTERGYKCLCPAGWTGLLCEKSVNECQAESETDIHTKADVCSAEGSCIDEHLSYSCNCNELRYGHRCQFYKNTCQDNDCAKGNVCIPKQNERDSVCSSTNSSNTLMIKCNEGDSEDQCLNRFLHFVEKNFIFKINNQPHDSLNIFPSNVAEDGQGFTLVSFFILIDSIKLLNKNEVLEGLAKTCRAIGMYNFDLDLVCFDTDLFFIVKEKIKHPHI